MKNVNKSYYKKGGRYNMFGILSAIVGLGLRGVCGVHNYIDNNQQQYIYTFLYM